MEIEDNNDEGVNYNKPEEIGERSGERMKKIKKIFTLFFFVANRRRKKMVWCNFLFYIGVV